MALDSSTWLSLIVEQGQRSVIQTGTIAEEVSSWIATEIKSVGLGWPKIQEALAGWPTNREANRLLKTTSGEEVVEHSTYSIPS